MLCAGPANILSLPSCYPSKVSPRSSHLHKVISSRNKMRNGSSNNDDKWSAQADLYSNQASRLTELHGADLVTILKDDILKAKTILDVGCGTGAFAKAYIQQFPKGIPGQTLILSDFSAGMLQKAKETVIAPNADFQTKLVYQEEDGTKLEGIPENSVDLVVSLFGVFLIPDQEATLKAIQRVLKKDSDSVFANGSWIFNTSDYLTSQGFGVSLQDAFVASEVVVNPGHTKEVSFLNWATKDNVKAMFAGKAESVDLHQSMHTTVWDFENLWNMIAENPMSAVQGASEEDAARAKKALEEFVTKDGSSLDKPIMLSTASILCVTRYFDNDP